MKKARDYIPALKYGAKILPSDLAGMIGLPSVGNIFYVDADDGNDTANSGTAADDAYKTVTQAFSQMTADQDDVLIIAGTNSTGRTTEAAAIDWNKRRCHIVGNGPARKINPRNGVSFNALGGASAFTVSANDCSFTNISFATFTDNNVLVEVTSDYNSFNYCHFQGMGLQATADDAAARSVLLTAAEENEFTNCTFGIDTVTRGAANASLELTGSCPRNKFINCDFPIFTDAATPLWIKASTGNCYERFLIIDGCNFFNPDNASSTTLTDGMTISATGNGDIYFLNSTWRGATDLASDFTNFYSNIPVFDTADAGLVKAVTT